MTIDEFSRAVEALKPTLYRVCRAQLSVAADREDAVQEAILRAWQKRHTLREPRYFNSWLIRILLNECHDAQRRRRRCVPMEALPEPKKDEDPRLEALRDALEALDEKQRLCVLLYYIEGYSVQEVARMLNIGESAVKQRLLRGRRKLKDMLSEEVLWHD